MIVLLNLAFAAKVATPAIETLSKFVCPSTSKSPFASILPVNIELPTCVDIPFTFRLRVIISSPITTPPPPPVTLSA